MKSLNSGFTLIEIVVAMTITMIVGVLFMNLSRDITDSALRFNRTLIGQQAVQDALQVIVPELRRASPSNVGAYPLITAGTSTLVFYSDISGDGLIDQVRYFLDGNTFRKGVISPSGSPLAYATSSGQVYDLVESVIGGSSIFRYFDSSATSSMSNALVQPVDPHLVKIVQISLVVDQGVENAPSLSGATTNAMIRNLRFE